MYTLKSIAQRGTSLTAAIALAIAAVVPAVFPVGSAYADALNPLTDRSLSLSSSAPGWQKTDGSGNTTYAQPNSGANGQKTGETFTFKVSTDTSTDPATNIKAMTFQYCTSSAGLCSSPGDNTDHVAGDTATTADLNVHFATPLEVAAADFGTVVDSGSGAVKAVPGYNSAIPDDATAAKNVAGNYIVYYNDAGTWKQSDGWTLATSTVEDGTTNTGKKNYITLTNADGLGIPSTTEVKVIFFGTTDNYITNPGSGAFFVKINTYKSNTAITAANVIDGGVTVANVMNQSIQIQTKVLETMDFSVGTVDPNTLDSTGGATGGSGSGSPLYLANGSASHGICDRILTAMKPGDPVNVLNMGDEAGEFSLQTDKTYSTHSYWRLSSNSSAGATVYYSGVTLSNTVGDQIDPIGPTAKAPHPGGEQFGLALDNGTGGNYDVDYSVERDAGANKLWEWGADNGTNGVHASLTADGVPSNDSWHTPRLFPLTPESNYGGGSGAVNAKYTPTDQAITTAFAFDPTSNTIPVPIASENSQVVDCVTAKMRYIANIAATTPAGIYTTSVNYIAAPQY